MPHAIVTACLRPKFLPILIKNPVLRRSPFQTIRRASVYSGIHAGLRKEQRSRSPPTKPRQFDSGSNNGSENRAKGSTKAPRGSYFPVQNTPGMGKHTTKTTKERLRSRTHKPERTPTEFSERFEGKVAQRRPGRLSYAEREELALRGDSSAAQGQERRPRHNEREEYRPPRARGEESYGSRSDRRESEYRPKRQRGEEEYRPRRERVEGEYRPKGEREEGEYRPKRERGEGEYRTRRERRSDLELERERQVRQDRRERKEALLSFKNQGESLDLRQRRGTSNNLSRTANADRYDNEAVTSRRRRDTGAAPSRRSAPSAGDDGHPADDRSQTKTRDPISIPYTTAVSQFLYGTTVVEAALRAARRKLHKLYIYQGEDGERSLEDERINSLARKAGVTVQWVTGEGLRMMNKMAQQRPHNGYVLEASPLPIPFIESIEAQSTSKCLFVEAKHAKGTIGDPPAPGGITYIPNEGSANNLHPLVILLSNVLDPGNLGAILRSAYFLGASAVVLPERETAPLSEVALKASAGAAEHIPIVRVKEGRAFVRACKESNWRIFAADSPDEPKKRPEAQQRPKDRRVLSIERASKEIHHNPCLVMFGGEGDGFAAGIRGLAHHIVGVPMLKNRGAVNCLNVSVASGLVLREFLKDLQLDPTHDADIHDNTSASAGAEGSDGSGADADVDWTFGVGDAVADTLTN